MVPYFLYFIAGFISGASVTFKLLIEEPVKEIESLFKETYNDASS